METSLATRGSLDTGLLGRRWPGRDVRSPVRPGQTGRRRVRKPDLRPLRNPRCANPAPEPGFGIGVPAPELSGASLWVSTFVDDFQIALDAILERQFRVEGRAFLIRTALMLTARWRHRIATQDLDDSSTLYHASPPK